MTYETKHPIRVATYIGAAAAATVLAVGSLTGGDSPAPGSSAPPAVDRVAPPSAPATPPQTAINVDAASCRVKVEAKQCTGRSCTVVTSWGSGTLIARQRVLTCSHLFDDGADWVTVIFAGKSFDAKLIKRDRKADLALLAVPEILVQVPGCDHPRLMAVVPTGYTDSVSERAMYTFCGFGSGPFQRGVGPFVAWTQPQDGRHSFIIRGFSRDGDSGGGVFDGYGRLVGVRWGGNRPEAPDEVYVSGGAPLVEFLWGR